MRISKLDHLVLVTSDLSRCVSFYRDLLHMEVEEKDGRFALRFSTSKINIHTCPGEFQPAAERPVPGSLDICFVTEEPLERLLDELKEEKAPLVTDIVERHGALGKMRSLYLRDPDGNLVEIAEYRKGGQHAYHHNQADLFYAAEYALEALLLLLCTWQRGTLDIRRQIGRKVFFRRLLLVLFVSVLGIALMTGIYFIRLEPEVRFAAVGAVQFFMTVCNSVILGSSFFQRYRVYPRGSALAAVLILMYGVSDFFMPREVKYAVLAASVIGGFLLPETWGNKQV